MKTLLFLNGPEGWQTGIEDGFASLQSKGEISELKQFYFEAFAKQKSSAECLLKIKQLAVEFLPELIVFFHIGNFPITADLIIGLKNLPSKPYIVYDEGDMYGGFAKPPMRPMKVLMKYADAVSIRGLGEWALYVGSLNNNIIYTPHHNDIARFDQGLALKEVRENEVILIGNRQKSRLWGNIRCMPGVRGRERFARSMAGHFGDRFKLYGNGWSSFPCNCGPVGFQDQMDYYKNTWITVAYEHYPDIPYYFSNRLPAALMAGSLYVCHYHQGYEKIFDEGDFIFFFKSNDEAVDIVNYILSLKKEDLMARSRRAIQFAKERYSPEVAWGRFLECIKSRMNQSL